MAAACVASGGGRIGRGAWTRPKTEPDAGWATLTLTLTLFTPLRRLCSLPSCTFSTGQQGKCQIPYCLDVMQPRCKSPPHLLVETPVILISSMSSQPCSDCPLHSLNFCHPISPPTPSCVPKMSEATDIYVTSSGSPPDAPTNTVQPSTGDNSVHDILVVADQVLSLERRHATERSETDEALEWHEVIELQAFSERRAWIEEKIKAGQ